jgi:diguanylate cyclase (GGDEF)-like protein/PAS domain S-box-containing protein
MQNVANFAAQVHGENVFDTVADFAARQFEADYVHVGLLEPNRTEVRVVAAQLDGQRIPPDFVYQLAGAPCANVVAKLSHCCHPSHVQLLYPENQGLKDIQAESYVGEPILDSNGQPLGLLVMVKRCALTHTEDIMSGLRILAARTAASLSSQRAEQAVRAKEHLLSTVIDEIPDVLALKDENGHFLLCNQALATLYHTTTQAMVGKHDGDFGVPADQAQFFRKNVLAIMARGKTEVVFEDSRDGKTGEIRNFKSIKKPFKNEAGNNRCLIIAHDITDVVHAQEKALASEQLLRTVLDVAQEGTWDWHVPSGRVTHNAPWYKTLDFRREDVPETLEAFSELLHPDDRPHVIARIDQLLQGKVDIYQSEHRLRDQTGRYRWVRDFGRVVERDANGHPLRVVGSFTDNTARLEAEHALREERETLRLIVDHAPIGIWLQDGKGKLSFVNQAFCNAMGISEERFLAAAHYADLTPEPYCRSCMESDARALIGTGITESFESLPFVDGRLHDLHVFKTIQRDAEGQPLAMLGLCVDITEQKQAEHTLNRQVAYNAIMQRLATTLINLTTAQVDGALNAALAEVGAFLGADRAYVFDYDLAAGTASNTLEWCAPGITPYIDMLQPLPVASMSEWFEPHQRGEAVLVPSVDALPPGNQRDLLASQGILSLLAVPSMTDGRCLRFVGLDAVQQSTRFGDAERDMLTLFAGLMANLTERQQKEARLNRQTRYTEMMRRLSVALINLPLDEVSQAIGSALAEVGAFFDADRAYVFDYDLVAGTTSNTFEWCATGISPQINQLQQFPISEAPDGSERHRNGQHLLIPSVHDLPPGRIKDTLEIQGILSALTTPIMLAGACLGFVGLDAVRPQTQFGDAESQLLAVFAELLANLTERKQTGTALQQTADRLDMATQAAGVGIWDMNMETGEAYHSQQMAAMLGYAEGELGANREAWAAIVHPDDLADANRQIAILNAHPDSPYATTFRVKAKDGSQRWIESSGRVIEHRNGKVLRMAGTHLDITERRQYQQQLEHIAHYDSLTGLPNRVLLADRLQQAMLHTQRQGRMVAVAYIDLDGFKAINDQYGHDTGDQLLTSLSGHMKRALREGDTLARMGGDEFVAILRDLTDATSTTPLLARLLAAAGEAFHTGGHVLRVSASLGVTFYPQADGVEADQLLRQADQAMYQAKLAGKNRYHIFDIEQDRSLRGHHESVARISQALNQREFVLHYQPKVNMRTGDVVGVEALIRWQHPERGLLPPGAFLSALADHPVAIDIGEWVLDTAMAQIETWKTAGLSLPVSVNIDAIHLEHPEFVARLQRQLAHHPGVSAGDLELEVLESSALADFEHVTEVIRACGEMGIGFALDDFGTGYSTLTYLKHLSVRMLKIDQSFVRDMLDDPDDLAILSAVLGLSSAFRCQNIAEGVEHIGHGQLLLQLGCELGQGYAIARPMPAERLAAWLNNWEPDASWQTQKPISRDDLPILFASVEHRAWLRELASYLNGETEALPPMHPAQCPFGQWLHSMAPVRQENRAALAALEPQHTLIHELASELIRLKQSGQTDAALAQLPHLHALRDQLLAGLQDMLT